MSPPNSSINPSQAVERIREIIVGRQLERIEQRILRLESGSATVGAVADPESLGRWEDRLCTTEARLEALTHSFKKLADSSRDEAQLRSHQQREEIQRLATQIQQVAAAKAEESGNAAATRLEGKIGAWLGTWQTSLQTYLNDREQHVSKRLREEVAALWENTESQITRLQSRAMDRELIEDRFKNIAKAALALAEAASPAVMASSPASGTATPTP